MIKLNQIDSRQESGTDPKKSRIFLLKSHCLRLNFDKQCSNAPFLCLTYFITTVRKVFGSLFVMVFNHYYLLLNFSFFFHLAGYNV